MKWLVGLFLVFIALRGRLPVYSALASGDAKKSDEGKSATPQSQLEMLMNLFESVP